MTADGPQFISEYVKRRQAPQAAALAEAWRSNGTDEPRHRWWHVFRTSPVRHVLDERWVERPFRPSGYCHVCKRFLP